MIRWMNIWFGLLGLRSSKLRSALTTLGIVIGVAAVIVIVSLGNGLRRATQEQMEQWNSGVIEVRPSYMMSERMMFSSSRAGAVVEKEMMGGGYMTSTPQLSDVDVEALRRWGSALDGIAPQFESYANAVYKGQRMPMGQILGVTPAFLQVYEREIKWGRFVTEYDSATAAPVVVIDEMMSANFFGEDVNPVGEVIHVSVNNIPQNFEIVGVLANPDEVWRSSTYALTVPLRTARLRLNQDATMAPDSVSWIAVQVVNREPAEREYAVAQIATLLRAAHGIPAGAAEDFEVRDQLAWGEDQQQVLMLLTLVLSLIAGISLVVGSIGLMNIMLVSVSERTSEIGVRRAMGARRGDVLLQFLSEAILLSLLGGILGFGLGALASQLAGGLIEMLQGKVYITADVVVIALGVSSVVGVLAGIYPAWRAALLQPTEALRHAG